MNAPYDRIMVADFETRWDSKEYTLSKMTTEEYVRDERFHAYGMGYKWMGDEKSYWIDHDNLPGFYRSIDWQRTAVLAHNAQFDCTILSWRYGVRPAFILDSLSMARALRGVEVGNSLAKLAEAFGLPPKGRAVHSTDGMGPQLEPQVLIELADYCKHDVWLAEQVYANLLVNAYGTGRMFPAKELRLIDMILRMYTEPRLKMDSAMLTTALKEERTKRAALLEKLNVKDEDLASNDKFADLLWHMGIETPMKESKTVKGKMLPAFAKTDVEFQLLLDHENEDVAALCEARLKVKSTLERTRAQRLLDISTRGALPVPLDYYRAHTGRIQASKGQAINMQNLKRKSFLRKAIMAPDGYTCVVADLSQIEARVLAWLAGYDELLGIFQSGEDVYATFGAGMFGVPGMTKDSHPDLRQSAKSAVLGAGYGLGWRSFAQQLIPGFLGAPPVLYGKTFAKQLGIRAQDIQYFIDFQPRMGESWLHQALAIPRNCTDEEIVVHSVCAQRIINKYREAADPVVQFWKLCEEAIGDAIAGDGVFDFKCIRFERGHIFLPNGMALRYPELAFDKKSGWSFLHGRKRKKLYGGALTENIVQALARIVMTDAMLRIQKRYPVVLTVHDEIVSLAPEAEAEEAKDWVLAQMVVEPKYMQGIPLAATCDTAVRYGMAK
jgi:DNA polymerase